MMPLSSPYLIAFIFSFIIFATEVSLAKILTYLHILTRPTDILPLVLSSIAIGALVAHQKCDKKEVILRSFLPASISILLLFLLPAAREHLFFCVLISTPVFVVGGAVLSCCFYLGSPRKVYGSDMAGALLGGIVGGIAISSIPIELLLLLLSFTLGILALANKKKLPPKVLYLAFLSALTVAQATQDTFNFAKIHHLLENTKSIDAKSLTKASTMISSGKGKLVASQWSSLSRVDIVESQYRPWTGETNPNPSYSVFFDNYLFSEIPQNWWPEDFRPSQIYLQNDLLTDILLIGVGSAPELKSIGRPTRKKIIGVEVNPAVINLTKPFQLNSKSIYSTFTEFYAMDGRSFVHNTRSHFDVIDLSAITSHMPSDRIVNIDDMLLTKEAFFDYLEKLTPGGILISQLSFPKNKAKFYRFLNLVSESLKAKGLTPKNHLLVYEYRKSNVWNSRTSFFVIRKLPWDKASLKIFDNAINDNADLQYLIRPEAGGTSYLAEEAFHDFLERKNLANHLDFFLKNFDATISVPTDDKPFFGVLYKNRIKSHYFTGFALLLFTLTVVILLVVTVFVKKQTVTLKKVAYLKISIAALLGLNYALQYIFWNKLLLLFIGVPSYSFISTIFGLIFGAWLATNIRRIEQNGLYLAISGGVVYMIALFFLLEGLINFLWHNEPTVRMIVASCLLLPIGFSISIPYQFVLDNLGTTNRANVQLAYAANTLFFSLTFGVAQKIALDFGFDILGAAGLAALLLVVVLFFQSSDGDQLSKSSS